MLAGAFGCAIKKMDETVHFKLSLPCFSVQRNFIKSQTKAAPLEYTGLALASVQRVRPLGFV